MTQAASGSAAGAADGPVILTNDDGVGAPGLEALTRRFEAVYGARVAVVAPAGEASATGHAITLRRPLLVEAIPRAEGPARVFAVSGTPVDCIKLAVRELLPGAPALLCAGVNRGVNLGTDVFYSGTVSAAIEGAIMGLPSLAVSLEGDDPEGYDLAADLAVRLAGMILRRGLPPNTLLNVNVPARRPDGLPGLRLTRLGMRKYLDRFSLQRTEGGLRYYVLEGETSEQEGDEGTDGAALEDGLVSITPIHLDLTAHALLASLEEWLK